MKISIGIERFREQSTSALRAESIESARLDASRAVMDDFRANPDFGYELNWDDSQWATVNAAMAAAMDSAEAVAAEWWDSRYSL